MSTHIPSTLDSTALARRLDELVGSERNVQVDFLLHLDEFDRRRAYLDAGFGSLWDYCLRHLHLREGAAGRRIGAMRALRRFPRLEPALRDGRLCISTAPLLAPVLTHGNLDELVARAAYATKGEVEHLVASLQPRNAPKEGIRKLPSPVAAAAAVQRATDEATVAVPMTPPVVAPPVLTLQASPVERPAQPARDPEPARPRPPEVRPVSEDQWSVRVTFDSAAKAELETLKALLSHKFPDGDLSAVLREAIRCGIEKHGKRKGATPPTREQAPRPSSEPSARITAAARREVWKRDGGSCCWEGPDGRRCGSRWQLEVDHIRPPPLGGPSDPANLRLLCRKHNLLHAEQVYGRAHMAKYRTGEFTIAGDSSWTAGQRGSLARPKRSGARPRGQAPVETGADTQT